MEDDLKGLKVIVIDDSNTIRRTAETLLTKAGCEVITATDGFDSLSKIADKSPDVIFVDIMMPRLDGYQTCALIKNNSNYKDTPVIMLSSKDGLFDKAKGRIVGADDYLTKPFSPRELVARIKALIRRRSPELVNDPIIVEGLVLDPGSHRVQVNNKNINIGPTEFNLLHFFMRNNNRVYSRNQILDKIWGNKSVIDDRTVDVHIKRLRESLKQSGYNKLIQTVRGTGYRFSKE